MARTADYEGKISKLQKQIDDLKEKAKTQHLVPTQERHGLLLELQKILGKVPKDDISEANIDKHKGPIEELVSKVIQAAKAFGVRVSGGKGSGSKRPRKSNEEKRMAAIATFARLKVVGVGVRGKAKPETQKKIDEAKKQYSGLTIEQVTRKIEELKAK